MEKDKRKELDIMDIIRIIALTLAVIALIISILTYVDIKKYSDELKKRESNYYTNESVVTIPINIEPSEKELIKYKKAEDIIIYKEIKIEPSEKEFIKFKKMY